MKGSCFLGRVKGGLTAMLGLPAGAPGGWFFLGYFLLHMQKKVTRRQAKTDAQREGRKRARQGLRKRSK